MTFSKELEVKLTDLGMNSEDIETLEELTDFVDYDTEDAFIQAIKDGDDLSEGVGELADSRVSVYTYDLYEWATKNIRTVQEYEKELLACGYDTIEKIFGVCWYRVEEENINDIVHSLYKKLAD